MLGSTQKKVTLSMDARLVREVKRLVDEGEAKSQSAFFEEAVRRKVEEARRAKRRRALERASKDPLFLADVAAVERDFLHADAESARMLR
jgi:metal-responsive CopG/Arc/MetJ family transcriptional regulator